MTTSSAAAQAPGQGPARSFLLDPNDLQRTYADERSAEIIAKTVAWFETRGKDRLLEAYNNAEWYTDFLEFIRDERIFATLCTPTADGLPGADGAPTDAAWDTYRNCEFAEVLGFYGLQYWYAWQVTVLGLGPIWMSDNAAVRAQTAQALEDGGIFAFGLSEKEHGADIYASSMTLTQLEDGSYRANGGKYYIGNGNAAALVSVFGRLERAGEEAAKPGEKRKTTYVFFVVDPKHEAYELVRNVVHGQSYVAEFKLNDYPITEADLLHVGQEAWDAALNTVNIGKYNLGWASVGICTHAFYEAIHHAAHRSLYRMHVTDFPHVQRLFVDAYSRLVAMKLFASRASDYMRAASPEDRRYLLYNPMVKMKVTTEGEKVIDHLWDVIAAKGFEDSNHFNECAVTIRALPKLEGTVHVNIALIIKFAANYFFNPGSFDPVPTMDDAKNDDFLFAQGPTRGLSKIQFHDYRAAYDAFDTAATPNIAVFKGQIDGYRTMLATCPPTAEQARDTDFLLAGGQLFALVVYGQLLLENAKLMEVDADLVDQMFDVLIRDFSAYALELHSVTSATAAQQQAALAMIARPVRNDARFQRVWGRVHGLRDRYEMRA